MQTALNPSKMDVLPSPFLLVSGDREDEPANPRPDAGRVAGRAEDLPYRVEVWGTDLKSVEQTLAMTANASIGYAAYYEATREYPDRYVVLKHKNRTLARWNPPEN